MSSDIELQESTQGLGVRRVPTKKERCQASAVQGKIWIDLDNSPHVPFFVPIVEELEKRNYSVLLTARDCFQVRELADFFHLDYKLIGRHSGKNFLLKLCRRSSWKNRSKRSRTKRKTRSAADDVWSARSAFA